MLAEPLVFVKNVGKEDAMLRIRVADSHAYLNATELEEVFFRRFHPNPALHFLRMFQKCLPLVLQYFPNQFHEHHGFSV